MTPVLTRPETLPKPRIPFSWTTVGWVSALLFACYAPLLVSLIHVWYDDADMGHGFFVPVIAGYIAWKKRDEIADIAPNPNWWGLAVMILGALQLWVGTLGAEQFLARTSLLVTMTGAVLLLGGTKYLKVFAFPLFLVFFMFPIPAIIYNQVTFPLQLIASSAAEDGISLLQIPVLRTGNVLELSSTKLNVVEACSGIRSLLTLTFLSLVYGYFFEKRTWVRIVLFFSTIPIAIIANAGRVTLTGVVAQFNPDLAEGLFHEAQGWVIFMVALAILVGLHQLIIRLANLNQRRTV
jgi:exosortase